MCACNHGCMLKMILIRRQLSESGGKAMQDSGGEGGNGALFCKLPLVFDLDQQEQEVVHYFTSQVIHYTTS